MQIFSHEALEAIKYSSTLLLHSHDNLRSTFHDRISCFQRMQMYPLSWSGKEQPQSENYFARSVPCVIEVGSQNLIAQRMGALLCLSTSTTVVSLVPVLSTTSTSSTSTSTTSMSRYYNSIILRTTYFGESAKILTDAIDAIAFDAELCASSFSSFHDPHRVFFIM